MESASFNTIRLTLKGYKVINIMRKGEIERVVAVAVRERVEFIKLLN